MIGSLASGVISLSILAGTLGSPESAGELKRFELAETHMGSSFKIVLYSMDEPTARRASRAAFDRIAALDSILSDYQVDSELSRLSLRSGQGPVIVSPDLFDVLERSRNFWERSGGAFDVTIGPVGRLWRRARRERKLPQADTLAAARKLVGSDKMRLDPKTRTVELTLPGMKLDVGGIAKGYASQAAIEVLGSLGINRALVAGAGDILVGDPPPAADGWTIGIARLDPSAGPPEEYLLLKNTAISTSGDAERFVVIDGHRYSHIIDPKTGEGHQDRAGVTVVAPDGVTADALDTAVYLMGPERGMELIESMPGVAARYVRQTPDGNHVFESSRFRRLTRTTPKDAVEPARTVGMP